MNSAEFYRGMNITKVMFGEKAIEVPVWLYVQNQGNNMSSFIGLSPYSDAIRYQEEFTHSFITGSIIVRPARILASDDFIGRGLESMITDPPTVQEWLQNGKKIFQMGE